MNLTFVQTADPFFYADMVAVTSQTVRTYAQRHGARYELYLGLKQGAFPWQATFNRVFLLKELIDRGTQGWVCYMDADAWVEDLSFDVAAYLRDKDGCAGIFTPSMATENWWDVNAGVFFLNLSHEVGVAFANQWLSACQAAWWRVADMPTFPAGGPDDQSILHEILIDGDYQAHLRLESPALINSASASFIRQHLRSNASDMKSRLRHIKDEVGRVLNGQIGGVSQDDLTRACQINDALYQGLLNRPADGGAENQYVRVLLNHGLRDGVELVAKYLTGSAEFRALR